VKLSEARPSTTAGTLSAAAATAVGYLAGLGWDLSQVDWSLALNWIAGLSGLGAFVGYATSESEIVDRSELPLGLRNNNPGNLRPNPGTKWHGQIGENSGFVVFDSDLHGLRAMARNLKNQRRIHGLKTLSSMLNKYAPQTENDTLAYIEFVSQRSGFEPNEEINFTHNTTLISIMRPMIRMENGQNPYSDEKLLAAIELA